MARAAGWCCELQSYSRRDLIVFAAIFLSRFTHFPFDDVFDGADESLAGGRPFSLHAGFAKVLLSASVCDGHAGEHGTVEREEKGVIDDLQVKLAIDEKRAKTIVQGMV